MANSCAPSTPASRIAQNPFLFENLSSADKELAQQGQIKRGMHKNAVLIAWGKPDGLSAGSRSGKSFEKWVYTSLSPIYTSTLRPYGAFGYSRFGYHRDRFGYYDDYGVGFGPELHYVQRISATVEFDQASKVTEWVTGR
jgi:hypothetical protein